MKRSVLIAIVILAGIAAWVISGQIGPPDPSMEPSVTGSPEAVDELVAVRVRNQNAESFERTIVVRARTQVSRNVELKVETTGRVIEIGAERGARIGAGELVVRLALDDRDAQLGEALALVDQREVEYFAAQALTEKGFRAETQLAEAMALLEAARAALVAVEDDIAKTAVKAPFDGVLEARSVELGSYLQPGDAIGRLVDLDPLWIVGNVTEREVAGLREGVRAQARLVSGVEVEGRVVQIAALADPTTRTFEVTLEVANPGLRQRDGLTGEIYLPGTQLRAHLVSRAVLVLNDEGVIGVRAVDKNDRVQFYAAKIVGDGPEGVWLAGLPETIRLITVGQDFVKAGQIVRALDDEDVGGGPQ
jgi:membrane fusion protein, multidrug efflux system